MNGADGEYIGFTYNQAEYNYIRNLQNDVVAVADSSGNIVVTYEYDVWGKVVNISDTTLNGIGSINPIRYRGYYYDSETELYYLVSRYYNPEVGRFLNADGYVSTGQGVLSYNMYSYCLNNPLNFIDPTGTECICLHKRVQGRHVCHDPNKEYVVNTDRFKKFDKNVIQDPVVDKKIIAIAQTIIGESGGRYQYDDWQQGQEAVVWTIINRYNDDRYPNDWIDVVSQKNQFVGYMNGKNKYESGHVDEISWDYAYELSYYAVNELYFKIPYPDGFTNEYVSFCKYEGQNGHGVVYAGNYFY